uniref:Uncharacterized protein n=1 Tax=Globisporangium ultimum (strain ATCC 200006 / CBS 805.95 / DAOM BR144) TaxID=431595 RepID=K3W5L8_GLOUD
MLSDHDSILATVIKDMTEMADSDFNELLLKQMPWLSQCAAAMDSSAIVTQVMSPTTLSECSRRLEQQPFPESFTSQAMNNVVCPFYKDTIMPCIIDAIADIGVRAMKNSGGSYIYGRRIFGREDSRS